MVETGEVDVCCTGVTGELGVDEAVTVVDVVIVVLIGGVLTVCCGPSRLMIGRSSSSMSLKRSKFSRDVETGGSFALVTMLILYDVSALRVQPWALAAILVLDGPEVIFLVLAGGDGQLSEFLSSGVGMYDFTHSCLVGYCLGDLFVRLEVSFKSGRLFRSNSSSSVGGFCQSRRSCASKCLTTMLHLHTGGDERALFLISFSTIVIVYGN